MIGDKVRTESYRLAIEMLVKDMVVIDVGAGTGILSIFAASSGAKKVYAIENAEIVNQCRQTIKDNGLTGKIEVVHCLAEEADLPDQEYDAIVSEWIGYFLLFERMLPSVLSVRDRYLKKGGIMIPQRARMYIAGVAEDDNSYGISLKQPTLPKFVTPNIVLVKKE